MKWLCGAVLALSLVLMFVPVMATTTSITQVSAGGGHTVALKGDGSVWAWGWNLYGQLGDGTTMDRIEPKQVTSLTGMTAIAAGGGHTIGLKGDGTVWAWGYNSWGQLGAGTITDRTVPVQVATLTGITAIAAADENSVALKSDGTVWTWGSNRLGELGNGTSDWNPHPTPGQVPGLTGISAVTAGPSHTVALLSDGTVWAWGRNSEGQLGDGTTTQRTIPVKVTGLTSVTAIAASYYHTVALKRDGSLWVWGDNSYGQLGGGTADGNTHPTPVQVTGVTGIAAIAASGYRTMVVKNDGTIWTWGMNDYGQLGDGTITTLRATPAQMTDLISIMSVAGGPEHSVALKSDGTVWAWGLNNSGQLGDGSTIQRLKPVQVVGFTSTPNPNHSPTIFGVPPASVISGTYYTFTPSANDQDNDALTFNCSNVPSWASFNTLTGVLTGTPPTAGTFSNIVISVSDGHGGTASLPSFNIVVASSGGGGGTGGSGTPVPVMEGWWLLPGMLAGVGMFARRRKE